jgi:hypothetical protein
VEDQWLAVEFQDRRLISRLPIYKLFWVTSVAYLGCLCLGVALSQKVINSLVLTFCRFVSSASLFDIMSDNQELLFPYKANHFAFSNAHTYAHSFEAYRLTRLYQPSKWPAM